MRRPFDLFVIFAGMRTGSNFLETNLNALSGVTCHGEAFNPHFIGYPKRREILSIGQAERDADPGRLLNAIRRQEDGLGGFRYFHDHDPRILEDILDDSRCAKIILTRNPVDSYVSRKIAQATGQWKLTTIAARKPGQTTFDAAEFAVHLDEIQAFHRQLSGHLQRTGQAAFHIDYEDLQDVDILNGLVRYLGVPARLDALDGTLKVQNPAPLSEKVENFVEMRASLASLDPFDLSQVPSYEPRRTAAVRSHIGGKTVPLLFMPIQGGPVASIEAWLAALDAGAVDDLATGMTQKDLRKWKRTHPGHRSFTVLRHPVERAHEVFCRRILSPGPESAARIRRTLIRQHGLPIPDAGIGPDWGAGQHRTTFIQFLNFLKSNLRMQTAIRVDAAWGSQSLALQGFGDFALPDAVLREQELGRDLLDLARRVGVTEPPPFRPEAPAHPVALHRIYDEEIERLTRQAYQRDYMMFGFGPWSQS